MKSRVGESGGSQGERVRVIGVAIPRSYVSSYI